MSLGRVIQEMSESLERLKKINKTAPVPMFEQAAMTWALDELRMRFPKEYVRVTCDKRYFSDGTPGQECQVYVSCIGMFKGDTFTLAMKALVDAVKAKEAEADVLQSASEAMAKAAEPDKAATERVVG